MTPDVNVLVAAFRDEHPHHVAAHDWLTQALEDCGRGGSLELLPMIAAGFVRVATNPKVFPARIKARAAHAFIRHLLGIPGVAMPRLGSEWNVFEKLCLEHELSGAGVTDGWIAAAIKANGLRLVTFDSDFADLLDPSECLLLQPGSGVQERRASYVLRRLTSRRMRAATA
jgi:uncharacterized protein